MKTIGDNIREIRSQLKLTQNEFAKALGYTERNVGNWEHGRSVPTVYTIKKMHEIFGLEYDEIFDFELK